MAAHWQRLVGAAHVGLCVGVHDSRLYGSPDEWCCKSDKRLAAAGIELLGSLHHSDAALADQVVGGQHFALVLSCQRHHIAHVGSYELLLFLGHGI